MKGLTKAAQACSFGFMSKQTKPHSCQKALYRIKNWSEYDKALVQRGSITFWLSEGFEQNWLYAGEKQRGSQFDYSERKVHDILARFIEIQTTQALIRRAALNNMTRLGMP